MLLNLATARENLWTYCDQTIAYSQASQAQKDAADFRINQVSERIINSGKWKNSIRRLLIPIYDGYITLPREINSLLGLKLITTSGCCVSTIIYSRFHEFAHQTCFCACDSGSRAISETAQTFQVPDAPFTFRVKSTETAGTISFIGGWDADDEEYFGAETLNISNGTVNGTRTYNSMPPTGGIQKTETDVAMELYSVDADGAETLIAVYAPYETIPSYKKYQVSDRTDFTQALIWGKLAYVPCVSDSDIVMPSNWGALKMALKALQSEDTEEDRHADEDWERCFSILDREVTETDTDAEYPMFRVSGQFACDGIINLT